MKKQNSGNKAKHRSLSLVILSCGLCLAARAVDFPSAGGNLADPAAWGIPLPSTSDGIVINQSGTYTATADIEFGSLTVAAQGITFDFDSSGNHRFRLANGGENSFILSAPTGSLTSFLGGIWDFAEGMPYLAYSSQISGREILFDGCCWTNLSRLTIARGTKAHSTELLMMGGAKVFTKELRVGHTSSKNILRITDGSSVVVDNGGTGTTVYIDNDNNGNAPQNAVYVEGSGSTLAVKAGKTVFGHKDMSGLVSVTNGATASFGDLTIGNNASASNNCLFVGNAASVTVGTLRVQALNCSLVVSGVNPQVHSTSSMTFANGAYLRFEIPQAGYRDGHCPLTASQVTFDAGTCRIEVDCADWLRAGGGKIKLAQASANDGLSSLAPALANASLPSGCKLCIKNNALFLKSERGFILSFR